MAASNAKVAALLRQYAAVLALQGTERFKIKAYRRAAETIESLRADVAALISAGEDLQELPGIGAGISRTIEEIVRNGRMPQLEKALSGLDPRLIELSSRPALDPKQVLRVYKKLRIGSLEELRSRLKSGAIREALGARVEFHIRRGLDERPRMLLYKARGLAEKSESFLRRIPGVIRVSPAGSLRRRKETIGDLNFVVSGADPENIFARFTHFGGVHSSEPRGEQEMLFTLSNGFRIGLHWASEEKWGLALLEYTGSDEHLEELRTHAAARNSRSRNGLVSRGGDASLEEAIYGGLGLAFIEPELREGRGEVAAAREGKLPRLIRAEDLKGDLHMHTTASDGTRSIAEMAQAARERGYEYIAITDHSQSLRITNGLSEQRLRAQIEEIDRINARAKGLVILKSAEVDILEDGRLDYPDDLLKELDLTICSIHSRFSLNREQQTNRILRAMDNPYFHILGHATGRLLLKREGYDLDFEKIVAHARKNGCFFEINASPDRLDLSDENARLVKEAGVMIAINTDAHSFSDLDFMQAGLNQARRAWLERQDVLNALPLAKLRKVLRRQ